MKTFLLALGLAIVIGLGAVWLCATTSPQPVNGGTKAAGRAVTFTTVDNGQYGQLLTDKTYSGHFVRTDDPTLSYLIISDIVAWRSFWFANQGHSSQPTDPPQVNFSKDTIVAVILGPSGGASTVRVTNVLDYQTYIQVSLDHVVDEHQSASLSVITHPYQIISIPNTAKPISLAIRRVSSKGE
jgi:hypothetical protein